VRSIDLGGDAQGWRRRMPSSTAEVAAAPESTWSSRVPAGGVAVSGDVRGDGGLARAAALRTPENGWSIEEAGMAQLDDIVGSVMKYVKDNGLDDNTVIAFSTDNGTENFTWPDGGQTPFAGGKGTARDWLIRLGLRSTRAVVNTSRSEGILSLADRRRIDRGGVGSERRAGGPACGRGRRRLPPGRPAA